MNNFFNFNRFALLVKRQWVENRKLFLMAMLVLVGMGIVTYSINLDWDLGILMNVESRYQIFIMGFFLGGSLFTNYVFKDLSDKNSSTSFLMIPASHFEKQLSACIYAFIIFPIVFLSIFFLLDFVFVNYSNGIQEQILAKKGIQENKYFFNFIANTKDFQTAFLILAWVVVQAFVVLGSISFMRWSYIKTGFAGFAIILAISLFVGLMQKMFLNDLYQEVLRVQGNRVYPDDNNIFNKEFLSFTLKYVLTPLFLIIAYFKLKEKQI
jgi:hypothetical protein